MDEREIQKILIEILYWAVNGTEVNTALVQNIKDDHLACIYRLAKQHDLAHVIANFVYRNKIEIKNEELQTRLKQEELIAVYRHERMKHAYKQICEIFEEACIAYVPLKGAVIRTYYPYEHMRTSCDIDILIHEEELNCAIACLIKNGYCLEKKSNHDVSLYAPNKTHLELHFNIQKDMDGLDCVLKEAWKHTALVQGSHYEFNKDLFVFHMYAHMVGHFLSGGCGIRSLMDIWIMEHKMGLHYSCAEELLKRAGIYKFASEMCNIANQCFGDNERDTLSELVLKYIFKGGVYGTKENYIAVQREQTRSAALYVWKRLFLPYKTMIEIYPILKRRPWLLPFGWIARGLSAIFAGKTRKFALEVIYARNVSDDTLSELAEIRSRLDI